MRRLAPILILLLTLLAVGTVGFQLLTGRPWIECLYLAVITLTTVGYREPTPLDDSGMLFIVIYLIGGASTFMFAIAQLGRWLVSNELKQALENRRMRHSLSNFKDHFIICGCGKMGESICRQLDTQQCNFVIIDNNTERVESLIKPAGWTFLLGDATDDDVLRRELNGHGAWLPSFPPTPRTSTSSFPPVCSTPRSRSSPGPPRNQERENCNKPGHGT